MVRVTSSGSAGQSSATPDTESLSTALKTALTPETRTRATAVAGRIRSGGATVAAKLLLDPAARA